jgi:hypothetical protein
MLRDGGVPTYQNYWRFTEFLLLAHDGIKGIRLKLLYQITQVAIVLLVLRSQYYVPVVLVIKY